MFTGIVYGLLLIFGLLGVIASVYMLMTLLRRTRAVGRFVVVIPCGAAEKEVASLLCAARLRMGLLGDIARGEVIALDCGLPDGVRQQCEALCREMDHIRLCRPEELAAQLRKGE